MTNLGPLTTAFTASSCPESTGMNIVGCGQSCIYWAAGGLLTSGSHSECYPSSYTPQAHFYSPGICPSGYTVACSSTAKAETIATCCPTALALTYGCVSEVLHPWMSTLGCVVSLSAGDSSYTFMSVTSEVIDDWITIPTIVSQVAIGAYGVAIRYQSTDFVPASTTVSCAKQPLTSVA
ncbi:hypothetical protein K461DRAFT_50023 [Myriangium duriaei CBS 260.36]|uniref:Uncharacterized protein n=1 Tax=Myriangium duriaei CBS 260.36 TaxID=1168546 RepID=A0A9P4IXQ4_9PEZI|nr:hypothetical protein K461DRAFT_50023 [Myriangium duriaei CBS 260.36]